MKFFQMLPCLALLILSFSCHLDMSDKMGSIIPANEGYEYVLFAWNDLGMHCLNSTYDELVILPPYNTIEAQLVKRGNPPVLITDAVITYSLADNSYSYGKSSFGQFWDNMNTLFGTTKSINVGLNDKGLTGTMDWDSSAAVYRAVGIPAVPINDSDLTKTQPYQQAIIVAESASGTKLAETRTTVPVSDEINCAKCHGDGTVTMAFQDIISTHDASIPAEDLAGNKPVLCASCHSSPALGTPVNGTIPYLSESIHSFHANKGASCIDCHPGEVTKCNRSLSHTAADGNCTNCHGDMENVASSINSGRIPWGEEPKCSDCHTSSISATLETAVSGNTSLIPHVDTLDILYRNAEGHGGMRCTACHGSPHAMIPSREDTDNYQAISYQNAEQTIGSCSVCHSKSHGEGAGEFIEQHGGVNPEKYSACNVCHTAVTSGDTSLWPHEFMWKSR